MNVLFHNNQALFFKVEMFVSSGTLMLQVDAFPPGDGVKVEVLLLINNSYLYL